MILHSTNLYLMLDIPCIRLLRYFRSSPVPFCKEDTVTVSDAFH